MINRYKTEDGAFTAILSCRIRQENGGFVGFVRSISGGWTESTGIVRTNKVDAHNDANRLANEIAEQNGMIRAS